MLSVYDLEKLAETRVAETRREAESRRLARRAGMGGAGWLGREGRRSLSRLGRLLTAWGEKLQRYSATPIGQPLRAQIAGGKRDHCGAC